MKLRSVAFAKVNLALHVTGKHENGFHTLESMVAFVDLGDHVSVWPNRRLCVRISGDETAGVPENSGNLAYRAARMLHSELGATIELNKRIRPRPVSAAVPPMRPRY